MKILLDTHVLLWWLENPRHLSNEARKLVANRETVVFVSAATVWEIVIKKALGKLIVPNNLDEVIAKNGFLPLPISFAHALALEKLPDHHRDPFDRMLVAQAMCEGLTIATRDANIVKYLAPYVMA